MRTTRTKRTKTDLKFKPLAPTILSSFYIYLYFVISLPLCNKYSDVILAFIFIHSVIIYVVLFGACMRFTRLCSLKPGCDILAKSAAEGLPLPSEVFLKQ